jgi:hypothetical protein
VSAISGRRTSIARAGHAVEQEWGEAAFLDRADENVGGGLLVVGQGGCGEIGLRARIGAVDIDRHRLEQAGAGHATQNAFGNLGDGGELADRRLLARQRGEDLRALRGHPRRLLAREPVLRGRTAAAQRGAAGQRHARDGRGRRAVIFGSPFDQPAQRRGEGRDRQHVDDRPQLAVGDVLRRQPLGLPDDPDDLPRPQRRDHDRAEFDRHSRGNAIVESAERGVEYEESDPVHLARI